jgi:hypothetical protein
MPTKPQSSYLCLPVAGITGGCQHYPTYWLRWDLINFLPGLAGPELQFSSLIPASLVVKIFLKKLIGAQMVECLQNKCKALSTNPNTIKKKKKKSEAFEKIFNLQW